MAAIARPIARRCRTLAVAAGLGLLAAMPAAQAPAPRASAPVAVKSITHSTLPKGDRITVELSDETTYTGERVSNPDRVFYDFSNATIAASVAAQVRAFRSALIKTVRVGSPARGVTRVVLELVGSPRYSAFFLYNPSRLVIDVETRASIASAARRTPELALAPLAPPVAAPTAAPTPVVGQASVPSSSVVPSTPATTRAPTPLSQPASPPGMTTPTSADTGAPPISPSSNGRGDYSLARQLGLRVAKIVIDPGHGGHDPGAISNGVTEAEVVLDIAVRLRTILEQTPGVEVVLTRSTNEFIPLEERTAIANREHADLFLSIHANSHRQPTVRGIETYFLNFASNPDAEAVAARENASSVQTMGTLPAIVKAIALNNKLDESREFATLLQNSLIRRLRTQSTATRDLGVKQAPFVVLIGAQMPSVLTEIAFLTNKPEAGLLKTAAYRQLIAQSLKEAVVKYQESLKRVSSSSPSRQE